MRRVGFALLLQGRLARRDLPLLIVMTVLTAVALLGALGGPLLLERTVDRNLQRAVVAAGHDVDLLVRSSTGRIVQTSGRPLIEPQQVVPLSAELRGRLPAPVRRVVADATTAVSGPELRLVADDVDPALAGGPIGVRIALLARPDAVRVRSGALPSGTASGGPVDVVLSAATARATSLRAGSLIDVPPTAGLLRGERLQLRVTGIVDRRTVPGPSPWTDLPSVWSPAEDTGGGASTGVTVLTDAAGLERSTAALGPFTVRFRLQVEAARLTGAAAPVVASAVTALRSDPAPLVAGSGDDFTVQSTLPAALDGARRETASTASQFTLLTTGVLGTAAVALVLLGGLLTGRRAGSIGLQRARGAAVLGVAAPALLEGGAVVAVAAAGAAAVVGLLGRVAPTPSALVLVVVALLAVPAQTARAARGRVARRAPANRTDRDRLARLRRTRRITLEAGLVVVAGIAVLVLTSAGGLGTARVDPLLVAVPLLVCAASTVVIARVVPPLVSVATLPARRARGVGGVLLAARAAGGRLALPLLALSLAFGLALNDGMLVTTIASGQEAAAWERVGADARSRDAVDVRRVAAAPGVQHASAVAEMPGISADLATTSAVVTVLAVDPDYPDVVAAVPGPLVGTAPVLRRLRERSDVLPVVVDAELARRMAGRDLQLQLDGRIVKARAVGTIAGGPSGWLPGPFVFVDLDALRQRVPALRANSALVVGPGAGAALRAAGAPAGEILTRSDWLVMRRTQPLVVGTRQATILAAALLGVFALAALAAAVLASAPDRRRTLSLLRTLGMRRRTGWWLVLADLLPLVLGGLGGGTAVGVIAAELLDPRLDLGALTGGVADPPVTISGAVLAAVAAGTLVVLAGTVGIEAVGWRRERIGETLRVGGQ